MTYTILCYIYAAVAVLLELRELGNRKVLNIPSQFRILFWPAVAIAVFTCGIFVGAMMAVCYVVGQLTDLFFGQLDDEDHVRKLGE